MTRGIFVWVIVMMIVGSGAYGAVSDHVLEIIMSSTYDYDYPGVPLHYEFEVAIQVDATVVGGNMYAPDGTEYTMFYSSDGVESWLDVYFEAPDPSVWDGLGAGTYTFTINYVSGPSDSTSVDYQLPNGDPIPYVTQEPQFVYPQHNAVDVPLQCILQFHPANDPIHTIDIWIEPEDGTSGALEYDIMVLPHDTSSYGPVTLSPMTLYECGYTINHFFSFNNADGIPTEIDTDAGTSINFTTGSEPEIDATLDIVADTITPKTKWITCHLWLPGQDVANIDLDSIRLGGSISAVRISVNEKKQMVVVRFSTSALNLAPRSEPYSLAVSGELIDGTTFAGSDDITVIQKGGKPN